MGSGRAGAAREGDVFESGRGVGVGVAPQGRPGRAEVVRADEGDGLAAVRGRAEAEAPAAAGQEDGAVGARAGRQPGALPVAVRVAAVEAKAMSWPSWEYDGSVSSAGPSVILAGRETVDGSEPPVWTYKK